MQLYKRDVTHGSAVQLYKLHQPCFWLGQRESLTEDSGYGCDLLPAVVFVECHYLAVLLGDGHGLHIVKVAHCLCFRQRECIQL